MRVLHINGTAYGGAANFVIELHEQLINEKIDSYVYLPKNRNVRKLIKPSSFFFKFNFILKIFLKKIFNKFILKSNQTITLGIFKSFEIEKIIKKVNPDIIHLHWIGNEFISIKEILKIKIPIVWTLHDMWAFLPFDHYKIEKSPKRNILSKKFEDYVNNYFLQKKRKLIKKKLKLIPTSSWMKTKLIESKIFFNKQIYKIPCAIDFKNWYSEDKNLSRNLLSIKGNKKIIFFIAMGGNNSRKGLDLLVQSLKLVNFDYQLIVAGDQFPKYLDEDKVIFFDNPKDLVTRRLLYSVSDVLAVPSRQESFGLVALEASACNTPSIIFEDNGLSEIIVHKKNGYIAKKDDIEDYANGINWLLTNLDKKKFDLFNIRSFVKKKFDIDMISKEYLKVYEDLISDKNETSDEKKKSNG